MIFVVTIGIYISIYIIRIESLYFKIIGTSSYSYLVTKVYELCSDAIDSKQNLETIYASTNHSL